MYDFSYQRPASIADAVQALGAADAKALAGGMTLIPVLKQRLNRPATLVDLSKLGLSGIQVSGDFVGVGAMTPHADVAHSTDIQRALPALAALASMIGDKEVRHRGTIGGSLANNDPAADYPAAALALGATIRTDKRAVAADDYFKGLFETALQPGELITAVQFPIPARAAYQKFKNPASRYAIVGVFVSNGPMGIRVAVTGAGQNGVFRHKEIEAALTKKWAPESLDGITTPAAGLNSDIHAGADYRAHLIGVLAKRAVASTV